MAHITAELTPVPCMISPAVELLSVIVGLCQNVVYNRWARCNLYHQIQNSSRFVDTQLASYAIGAISC
jgi:hypothetical protein